MKKIINILLVIAMMIGLNVTPVLVHAAGASISLTANKATVGNGGSLIVAIYMNGGGTGVNAVEADLSYPASKLQYVGFSAAGSAFEIAASSSGGGGTASIARGTTSNVTGSGLVGTVTFLALSGTGSASISVGGSSSLVSDGNAVAFSPGGVSVNFGAVAATSSPSASTPATPAVPAAPKDTTPPVISAIKTKGVGPFAASITWTTDEASDSVVEYGLDTTYGLSASSSTAVTAHQVALGSSFLTPETLLHYRVKSTDSSGNVQTSPDQTLSLPGVPVTIIVRGANGKPQSGVEVTLDSSTSTTDHKGTVTLTSGLGNKQITSTYQGVTVRQPVTVKKTVKPFPPIQLDLAKQPLNSWMLTSLGLLLVVLVLAGIDAFVFGSRLFARLIGLRFRHPITVSAGSFAVSSAFSMDKPASTPNPVGFAGLPTLRPVDTSPTPGSPLTPAPGTNRDVEPTIPRSLSDITVAPAAASAPALASRPTVLPQMTPLVLPKHGPLDIMPPATLTSEVVPPPLAESSDQVAHANAHTAKKSHKTTKRKKTVSG